MTTPLAPTKSVRHLGVDTKLDSVIGSRIVLQGLVPASQIDPLTGLPTSSPGQRSHVDWLPQGKPASELDFRAYVASCNAQFGSAAIVRYAIELSHGDYTWQEPAQIPNTQGACAVNPGNIVPARGVSIRLPARQLRVWFWIEGTLSVNVAPPPSRTIVPWVPTLYPSGAAAPAGTPPRVEIVSSFEPVVAMARPLYPTQDLLAYPLRVTNPVGPIIAGPMASIFPMTANEFRVRDFDGQPFVLGVNGISYQGLNGVASPTIDASLLADWNPIPWYAALLYSSSQVAQVDYR